jgi:hypothetical protein
MRFFFLVALFFPSGLFAQGFQFEWAGQLSGHSHVESESIVVANSGDSYTTGTYRDTADFDPGSGTLNLTTTLFSSNQLFIEKLDASGQLIWVKNIEAAINSFRPHIAIDNGDTYVAGRYTFTNGDIDPGPAEHIIDASNDAVMIKLNDDGEIIWVKNMAVGDGGAQTPTAIEVDTARNVIAIGDLSGAADFDPGSDTLLMVEDSGNVFIQKLDIDRS